MEYPENVPNCSLYQVPPTLKISWKSVQPFSVMLLTGRQTNRQARATDNDENITFAKAEVITQHWFNTLRPRPNGRHFADDIFKRIFLNENILIPIKISLKFVPKGHINNIPSLVKLMAWRRPSDKPLSEPIMVRSPTHICVTRPQWVK